MNGYCKIALRAIRTNKCMITFENCIKDKCKEWRFYDLRSKGPEDNKKTLQSKLQIYFKNNKATYRALILRRLLDFWLKIAKFYRE